MTPNEFKAWLDGYLDGNPEPDVEKIREKAQEMTKDLAPAPLIPYWNPPVEISPTIPSPPWRVWSLSPTACQ